MVEKSAYLWLKRTRIYGRKECVFMVEKSASIPPIYDTAYCVCSYRTLILHVLCSIMWQQCEMCTVDYWKRASIPPIYDTAYCVFSYRILTLHVLCSTMWQQCEMCTVDY